MFQKSLPKNTLESLNVVDKIDCLVYELCGSSDDEINIIGGN